MTDSRGVLTLAYGPRRYHRQAKTLALSLIRHSPGIPRTLATDRPDCPAAAFFDTVVPIHGTVGRDFRLKLNLDQYSPYQRTLFLDADSIAVRPIEPIFDTLADDDLTLIGRNISDGHWYGDVKAMTRAAGTTTLPMFNGGALYFTTTERSNRIFTTARDLATHYTELGLQQLRGGIADEPLFAIAAAREGITARHIDDTTIATLCGINTPLKIDALSGTARYTKRGRPMNPAVVHFVGDFSSPYRLTGAHYRRERLKLRLSSHLCWPDRTASTLAGVVHGFPCLLTNNWLRLWRRPPRDC